MAFHSCMCCCTEPLATAASHPVPSNMHSKQMYLWCGLVSRRPTCSSAVNECVNKCVSPCLYAFVGVLAGPAAASQTGELWLHVPTHKERQKADTDFFFLAAQVNNAAVCFYTSYLEVKFFWVSTILSLLIYLFFLAKDALFNIVFQSVLYWFVVIFK